MDNQTRTVLAYFTTDTEAESAADKLRQMGIETVQVDRISKYPGEGTEELFNPITGHVHSLSELTLGVDADEPDKNILSAADPSASGMGPAEDQIRERAYLVTAVCPQSDTDKVAEILKAQGGMV